MADNLTVVQRQRILREVAIWLLALQGNDRREYFSREWEMLLLSGYRLKCVGSSTAHSVTVWKIGPSGQLTRVGTNYHDPARGYDLVSSHAES